MNTIYTYELRIVTKKFAKSSYPYVCIAIVDLTDSRLSSLLLVC
jgi:hypothetical protein